MTIVTKFFQILNRWFFHQNVSINVASYTDKAPEMIKKNIKKDSLSAK